MSKSKKISISVVSIVAVLVILFVIIYLYNPIEVKASKLTVEYGKKVPTDAEFYVKNPKGVDVKVDTKKVKDKDFEACGDYEIVVCKDFLGFEKEKKITVCVADTVNPEFDKLPTLETVEGTAIDLLKYVSASDLSGIKKLEADSKTYDFNKAGDYTVSFCAIDNNNNKTVKTCLLKVAEKQGDSEVVFTTDSKGNLVATQKAKPRKYSYSTSSKGSSGGSKKTGGHTVIYPKETGRGKITGGGGIGVEYEEFDIPSDWD